MTPRLPMAFQPSRAAIHHGAASWASRSSSASRSRCFSGVSTEILSLERRISTTAEVSAGAAPPLAAGVPATRRPAPSAGMNGAPMAGITPELATGAAGGSAWTASAYVRAPPLGAPTGGRAGGGDGGAGGAYAEGEYVAYASSAGPRARDGGSGTRAGGRSDIRSGKSSGTRSGAGATSSPSRPSLPRNAASASGRPNVAAIVSCSRAQWSSSSVFQPSISASSSVKGRSLSGIAAASRSGSAGGVPVSTPRSARARA